jgi:hypothetical protein
MPNAFPADKDPKSPATTSIEWDEMIGTWDMANTLLGGTQAMRAAAGDYLPQHTEETDPNYSERLHVNILFNAMEITLDHFVGRPFSDPVRLNTDVPDRIVDHTKNLDLQGNNMTNFCREWFREGIAKGFCHVLIDMPALDEDARMGRTRADDLAEGRRPYWQLIRPENMIFAEAAVTVDPVTGELREHFTHVRLHEVVVERVGFAQEVKQRIRVLEPGFFEVWELRRVKGRKPEWVPIESGFTGIPFIPIVTFYANRKGFMRSKPPLEDLMFLNVRHWQSMSDQINILTVVRFPMLAVAGATEQAGTLMRIGPRQLLQTKDANGRYYYVEHTGKSIEAGWNELEKLEEDMEAYGSTFLKKEPGTETATAKALDSAESVTPLQDMTQRFMDSVNIALDYHAFWLNEPDGGTVTITTDFGPEDVTKEDVDLLDKLRERKDISRKAMIKEVQRRGVLSEEYDEAADFEQLKLEDQILKPLQPQTPGTFDVKDPDGDGKPGITRPGSSATTDPTPRDEDE